MRQPGEHLETLRNTVLVRRECVVGKGLPFDEVRDFRLRVSEIACFLLQPVRLARVARDRDQRPAAHALDLDERQRRACADQTPERGDSR